MSNGGGGAAPTGCYKCGRPGHWSRDCPSEPPNNDDIPKSTVPESSRTTSSYRPNLASVPNIQKPKTKAPRRTLPKLTPDLLLSDAGIGHILRYFPRQVKARGRGHEVDDLQHLLGLYAEWHSRLLPYYNLDQFIHKVEQVGATKRVKVCLRELRDKISSGADPTKLHETQVQEQDAQEGLDMPTQTQDNDLQNEDASNFPDDMLQDIWEKDTDETLQPSRVNNVSVDISGDEDASHQQTDKNAGSSCEAQITEEQRARIEANRLKVLERAKSQPSRVIGVSVDISGGEEASHQIPDNNNHSFQMTEEQRARIEANRLKALERAAAKSRSLHT